jgi:hypothetical protein
MAPAKLLSNIHMQMPFFSYVVILPPAEGTIKGGVITESLIRGSAVTYVNPKTSSMEKVSMGIKKAINIFLAVAVSCAVFSGCKKEEQPAPTQETQSKQVVQSLKFVKFGPTDIKAGTDFNVQSNGVSAMWAVGENLPPSTIIVIKNTKLHGFPGDKGSITTPVPKELYAQRGEYPIYLLDTKTGAKSNELKFLVE